MTDPKPSTNDILSKIRAKAATPAAASPAPAEAPAEPAAASGEAAASPAPAASAPAAAPKSTADILAAARAKAAAKPVAAAPAAPAAPAAGGAKGTTDIMASIRAKVGAAPAAAPASAAAPAAAAKPEVAKPVGMSPAEMIKAARSAATGAPEAPKVVLPTKPLPGKAPAAKAKEADVPRRGVVGAIVATLLSPIVIAWGSFTAALGASGLALARFMMPNVLVEPPTKFKIGPPSDYAPGTVSTKWQAQFNIWVVNNEVDGVRCIYALSTVCTHLGCTPSWLEGEQKFKCPCHGSGFYKSGINFEGPAPRPLERVGLRLAEDGMLEVDKSVKFQRELGQWTNAASFVGVG
ncbi:MAG: ubiquinol-cytochrome c reductase iron-sulfur subunit [Planctomycetaceae bacterium]|nr:ubiquinol-cytochrome c reductase iron-sulfur subunit [Planctomycetaceae bacterium]